jgi:membrane-associated phospholipid phosphatase
MDSLVVVLAQYLPFLVPAAAAVVWLTLPRAAKVGLAFQAIVSVIVVVAFIQLAAAVHTDPRPFVVNPAVRPLFAHPADNGFPSDHTAFAATVSFLVMRYRRRVGLILLAASVIAGAARVAAHVHHVEDIAAGVLIAGVTAVVASAVWTWVRPRLRGRLADRLGHDEVSQGPGMRLLWATSARRLPRSGAAAQRGL